jgi:hypothetical protein
MAPVAVFRAVILLSWLLSPAIFAASALFRLKRTQQPTHSFVVGIVLLVNWALFIVFLNRSETPYGAYYHTSWSTDILLLLSFVGVIASIAVSARKWRLSLGNLVLITLSVCIGYAPGHWLRRVEDFASVTVDGHPVPAAVYFGHPTDSEAQAVALVRIRDGGDYFLDFGSEKVRQATRSEYVRLPGGAWCLRRMQEGAFHEALRSEQLNQFRIASDDNHTVVVQF